MLKHTVKIEETDYRYLEQSAFIIVLIGIICIRKNNENSVLPRMQSEAVIGAL